MPVRLGAPCKARITHLFRTTVSPGISSYCGLLIAVGVLSPSEHALYIPYCNGIGPYDGTDGYVMKYYIENSTWVDITPAVGGGFGYGALTVDLQKPGTVM